ncbi:MAG TPA: hypothetical protein PLZ99_01230 [Parcubacteria group bacterium]|jgi:hypothetical protein|nr:hypothetical protein [Parcubacteria group bacterium]
MKYNKNRGYIALITSIFISVILFSITLKQNIDGWNSNYGIIENESKFQSKTLAERCVDVSIIKILNDTYVEGTTNYDNGSCKSFIKETNSPEIGLTKFKTQAVVNKSFTNIETVLNHQTMKIISKKEIPKI